MRERGVINSSSPVCRSFKKTHTNRRNLKVTLDELCGNGFRVAVELRHESWFEDTTYQSLRRRNVALVIAHGSTGSKTDENGHVEQSIDHGAVLTADWTYLRFHGTDKTHRFRGAYSPRLVTEWATRVQDWLDQGIDVYAFTNNVRMSQADAELIRADRLQVGRA